jgi:hypothetical protein
MKTRNQILFSLLVIGIMASSVYAQKPGSTSMQFLKVMPCARATALGDAYSVWASGSEALFWNPSGVALEQNQDFTMTYIGWIFDTKQYAVGYVKSLGDIGAVGLQLQYVDYGSFEEAVVVRPEIKNEFEPGLTGRKFSPYTYLVGLTYAKSLTEKFSLGVSMKYAHESLYDKSTVITYDGKTVNTYANAILFDFGVRYNTEFKTIQVAAAVQNFGPDFTYAVEKNHAPLQFRVGLAADIIGPNSLLYSDENERLGFALDLFQPNDFSQQVHAGMEFEFMQMLALRLGYKYNYDSEGLTYGGGIKKTLGGTKLTVDYSYGATGTYIVGNAHRISLGVELQ